ncbi:unnamed protein product [Adineta ricciae]|nr:unnamed protein product [Adineta ricciae]
MLVSPMDEPHDVTLRPMSEDPSLESFSITDKQLVINIIEISFVRGRPDREGNLESDNQAVNRVLERCISLDITKFHLICFTFSITAGIRSDDIDVLQLFIKCVGPELSRNSCLIITHAEAKTEEQRDKLRQELLNDSHFNNISNYFERGILFAGSINYDDYQAGNTCIIDHFMTIIGYRKELLDEICKDCQPFQFHSLSSRENDETEKLPKEGHTVATENSIRNMISCPIL